MTSATADVVIVGAGPAGRALAHRLAGRGPDVLLVDPHPTRGWHATYASFTDELPPWLPADVTATVSARFAVFTPYREDVERSYSVLDQTALQAFLSDADIRVCAGRADRLTRTSVHLDDGREISAGVVVDARGGVPGGPRQTAYGVIVATEDARRVAGTVPTLMDWRRPAGAEWSAAPSFLYAVDLDDRRTLLEETCLVGDPALPVTDLRARLSDRCAGLGLPVLDEERVSFPMTGVATPWRSPTPLFGARAGLMHPATGYSVAATLGAADQAADAVICGADPGAALWPSRARSVQRLRFAGLGALLGMDASATTDFFQAFFALSPEAQRSYLSVRTDLTGTVRVMLALAARSGARPGALAVRGALTTVMPGRGPRPAR